MPQTIFQITGATQQPPRLSASALVLIDAQNEYVSGRLQLANMEAAITAAAELLTLARAQGVPIFHIVQIAAQGRPIFTPGTHLAEIISELKPHAGEVVIGKRHSNAFAGTDLLERFHATDRSEMILAGFMTHNCVSATARAAEDHNIRTTIVAAATATRDLADPLNGLTLPAASLQAAALTELSDRVSTIVPDASALNA